MTIITVKIAHVDGKGQKTYRYDTAKGEPDKWYTSSLDVLSGTPVIAKRTDQQLHAGLTTVVVRAMYPLPHNKHSRAVALAWITEMERRGILEFDQHEPRPTISFGWGDGP
jgi:hypothetical protein